ncbi:hypothetical protein [Treponema sp. R80B11-R83G3]
MKKKIGLVLILFSFVAGGVFGQFSIDGAVSTYFNGITPSIGIGLGFSKIDLLAGVSFNFFTHLMEYEDYYDETIYVGLAPKASLTGNWSLSFPLLAQIWSGKTDSDGYTVNSYFDFAFRVGARATYAFSDHWCLYTGFLINAIFWNQEKNGAWTAIDSVERTNDFGVFSGGVVQFGIIYKFGSSKNNTRASSSENEEDDNILGNQNNAQRQPREQVSIPQLGEPTIFQQGLNRLPTVPIGGKNLKFEFGGDIWTAKVNGQNFLAGDCIIEENGNKFILTLKTTNVWSGAIEEVIDLFQKIGVPLGPAAGPLRTAAGLAAKVAKWIPFKGSSIILEYNEDQPASLRLGSR